MKTDTQTLARAMDILSRDIQSQDGIANAAIREAAERLRELDGKIDADLTRLERERDEAREKATTAWTENLRLDSENRRLERHRDEARTELARLVGKMGDIYEANKKLQRERDQLRADIADLLHEPPLKIQTKP